MPLRDTKTKLGFKQAAVQHPPERQETTSTMARSTQSRSMSTVSSAYSGTRAAALQSSCRRSVSHGSVAESLDSCSPEVLLAKFNAATPGIGDDSSMLRHERNARLEEVVWRWDSPVDPYAVDQDIYQAHREDNVKVLDCWTYQDTPGGDRQTVARYESLTDADPPDPIQLSNQDLQQQPPDADSGLDKSMMLEKKVALWLRREGRYAAPVPVDATVTGGIRLVMCDRPNMTPGMTMPRRVLEIIEAEFDLHDATLPSFFDYGGRYSIYRSRDDSGKVIKLHIVVKATQKVEVANYLLSLTYDVATRWTDAFLCGDGVVISRRIDEEYGHLEQQLLEAIAGGGAELWTNPMLLPTVIFQVCANRALSRVYTVESRLVSVENELGVTFAAWSGDSTRDRSNWPMDIKVKWSTRQLHSTMPQILFLGGVTAWQKRYGDWLRVVVDELAGDGAFRSERSGFELLQSHIGGFLSSVEGSVEFFDTLRGRAQSQIDLLFSVIGQRDSLVAQKANDLNFEVAMSTKEDSISMKTFTFISAVFLPLSFVTSLLSMSMFDWSNGDAGDGPVNTVSGKFWVFWVIAVPLTAVVMAGWWWWYGRADKRWNERVAKMNGPTLGGIQDPETEEELAYRRKMEREQELTKRKEQEVKQERLRWEATQGRRKGQPHFHLAAQLRNIIGSNGKAAYV